MKLSVYVPDDLADEVRQADLPVSAICQAALRKELDKVKTAQYTGTEEIKVEVGDPARTVAFHGRWLVEPDRDDTRAGDDAGAYWGVAITRRGRIAVYRAHCNERWPARLDDYDADDWAEANGDGLPDEILDRAHAALTPDRIVYLDI